MLYPHTKKITQYLKARGYAKFVVEGGLNYLIPKWKKFVSQLLFKEDNIYEFLNYLDGRRIIDEIMGLLSSYKIKGIITELEKIDIIYMNNTFEIKECIVGSDNEKKYGYDRKKYWYYYRMNEGVLNLEKKRFHKLKRD